MFKYITQPLTCRKYVNMSYVTEPKMSKVNFIHSCEFHNFQFCEFLSKIEDEYPDLPFYPEVQKLKLW